MRRCKDATMSAADSSSTRARRVNKHDQTSSVVRQESISIPVAATSKRQSINIFNSIAANIKTLFELSFLFTVYIFQPWVFIEIYLLPTFATMSMNFNPKTSISSLSGKVILVTGGNTGLGKEAILQLARHGPAKIYMGARSAEKATAAINSINNQLTVPTEIEHLPLDLNDLNSVKNAASVVLSKSARLDILMLNAGIMATPSANTAQGFDDQMGVNHVAHFYLTQQLLPLLTATAAQTQDVRVVALTSEAYNLGPSSLDTIFSTPRLTATSPWSRYGASKAANIMFTSELARRYPALTTASVHPGIIMTDLHSAGQESWSIVGWTMKLLSPFIAQDVPHGAYNQLWAATDKGVKSGGYYTPVGRGKKVRWVKETEGRRCWEWTEEEIKKAGF